MLREFIKTANWTLFTALKQLKLEFNPPFPICLTGSEIWKLQNGKYYGRGKPSQVSCNLLRLLDVCFLHFFAIMNPKFWFGNAKIFFYSFYKDF